MRSVEEIYQALLETFAQRAGFEPETGCDLAVRLWATAAQLQALEPMMREGCAGQLPEIYEGDFPTESKGCFGQAWSVGEMLRVFEAIEK